MDNNNYEESAIKFNQLDDYKDSKKLYDIAVHKDMISKDKEASIIKNVSTSITVEKR